jgi:SNF2 family DNA or RNA helicase
MARTCDVIAKITTDGKYVMADIPYAAGAGPRKAREVPGARPIYDKPEQPGMRGKFLYWRYPLTMDTCRTFRRVFGDELQVHDNLSRWARAQIKIDSALDGIRSGEVRADFNIVGREAPKLLAAINSRSYQSHGAAFLALSRGALLGDEPGLGKTLQALAAILESDSKTILVTCPRTATRTVWMEETHRWAPSIGTWVAQGSHAEREAYIGAFMDHAVSIPGVRKMLIVNTEMVRAKRVEVCPDGIDPEECFRVDEDKGHKHKFISDPDWPQLHNIKWDAIVMDESHMSLASTKNVQSKNITQVRFGAMQIRKNLSNEGLAIAMSGTPFRSRLTKAWGTLNWLRPDVFTSYWNFAGTHFGVKEGTHGMVVADGAKNPEPLDPEAFRLAITPYVLQRTKGEVATDLPPKQYMGTPSIDDPEGPNYVWIDMDEKQARAYAEMKRMSESRIKGGTLKAMGLLSEITRLRQFALTYGRTTGDFDFEPALPSAKFDWLMEFLLEREDRPDKVVVASSFTAVIELFARQLAKDVGPVYQITGNTSDRERARVVNKFNDWDDPVKVCLLNSAAGGVAITLDKCCDDLVFLDLPWTSDEATQVEDRIHRVSRIHNVSIHRLVSRGTVDQWMAENGEEQRVALLSGRPDSMRNKVLEALA